MLMLAGNSSIIQYMEIKTNTNLWRSNTYKCYQTSASYYMLKVKACKRTINKCWILVNGVCVEVFKGQIYWCVKHFEMHLINNMHQWMHSHVDMW